MTCTCPNQLQPHEAMEAVCPPDAPGEWLRGDWMQLYSGGRFYPKDPRPEEIEPADIAHSLSLLCRYGGHVTRFYSVAEHCVKMSLAVAPAFQLQALLHDATEAYVVDVPRPLKAYLPEYKAIEASVWEAIAKRFSISSYVYPEVHEADTRILLDEIAVLMPQAEDWHLGVEPLGVWIEGWEPRYAEKRYLSRLGELTR